MVVAGTVPVAMAGNGHVAVTSNGPVAVLGTGRGAVVGTGLVAVAGTDPVTTVMGTGSAVVPGTDVVCRVCCGVGQQDHLSWLGLGSGRTTIHWDQQWVLAETQRPSPS